MSSYSQFKAFQALTKASIRSMLKSPSSVVFSIAFPLVFILVFGFIGDRTNKIKVGISVQSELNNPLYTGLSTNKQLQLKVDALPAIQEDLKEGKVQAMLNITKAPDGKWLVEISAGEHNAALVKQLEGIVNDVVLQSDPQLQTRKQEVLTIKQTLITDRSFKLIDFILPGQLGFSLLAASVFGTAFVFYHMRQMLVLKRFFATPIRRSVVLLSEGFARVVFQLTGALIIILIGKYFFDYTLINGWLTVLNMLIVCGIGLLVFMSFGFVISGIAKSDSVIPPLANIFTMPQFLLAGTFFAVDVLPGWLQFIAKLMPLTYFNNALRAIAFDGAGLWTVRYDLLILLLWGVIGYGAASKLFKWE